MEILVKRAVPILLISAIVCLALPVWSADKNKDEETLEMPPRCYRRWSAARTFAASVVAKADCIIIMPSVKKFAVGIGGSGGRGPMSCRAGSNFSGKWSAPAMYHVGGASAGFQVGGTATDFILLIMAPTAVNNNWTARSRSQRCDCRRRSWSLRESDG